MFLENIHISHYEQGNRFNHEPTRKRKLLMHKSEIIKLYSQVKEKSYTLVPLRIYFDDNGRIKVEIGLAKGKKNYDKRHDIAARDVKRDIERALRGEKNA